MPEWFRQHARSMDSFAVRVGARLRWLRTHAQLSQEEVAERAGITPDFVGRIERGEKLPALDTLHAIAKRAFRVPIEECLRGVAGQSGDRLREAAVLSRHVTDLVEKEQQARTKLRKRKRGD